jgi:hypothetical protein
VYGRGERRGRAKTSEISPGERIGQYETEIGANLVASFAP